MECQVLFTAEFEVWGNALTVEEQEDVDAVIRLLEMQGPSLRFPYSSGVSSSTWPHMRELRIQHAGKPYRVLYAFNPLRAALLLNGGEKTGDDRWNKTHVPVADRLYREHVDDLKRKREI
jgi:hypothetical protein